MGTINHAYDPAQQVWVINSVEDNTVEAVQPGTVIRVRADVLVTETKLAYDIRLGNQTGTFEFKESDVFVDLTTALTEYEIRLT